METMTVRRVYRYRLEPTAEQAAALERLAGARRWTWNWALGRHQAHYAATGTSLSCGALSAELTALKRQPETAWLREADSQALQQALRDLARAFEAFFERRARYPRFKARKARLRIPQRVAVVGQAVSVPKIGLVRARIARPIEGMAKGATFKRDACGPWFVSIVAEGEMPATALPLPAPERAVGVDAGLRDVVVTSDGERIAAPRSYRALERKLRRAQRTLARKTPGSHNHAKARLDVAEIYQSIANKRNDFCHKVTTALVKTHEAVCIEDLHVKSLARTKLGKSFYDVALGTMRRQVEYKGVWYRTHVVAVGRFYPSSTLCHACGYKHDGLTLSDRTWVCPECGPILDRDVNAARNIKREGLRLLAEGHPDRVNACGRDVRPPMAAIAAAPA